MKICKKCGLEKENFATIGVCSDCRRIQRTNAARKIKDATNERERLRAKQFKEEQPEEYKRYRANINEKNRLKNELKNKDKETKPIVSEEEKRRKKCEYTKKYREDNRDFVRNSNKKWREKNSEELKKKKKEYYEKTKVQNRDNKYKIHKLYLENNPKVKFSIQLRGRILAGFRRFSKHGKTETCKEYGIDFEAIYNKIGPKPDGKYHLDHIIPISLFNFDLKEHVRLAHCPENLRWVTQTENLKKFNKIIPELIIGNKILESICIMLNIDIIGDNINGKV